MSYRLENDETVEQGARRIVAEQIDKARAAIASAPRHEAVHEVRKRCKKIRAVLRLVRPALGSVYRIENRRFRDIARRVSTVRDAQVMSETFDALMHAFDDTIDRRHYAPLRNALEDRRNALPDDALDARLREIDTALLAARGATGEWVLNASGFDAIGPGLGKTYGRARKAMKQARKANDAHAFHAWRKRVKYHRHHCDLLRGIWPAVLSTREDELHRLSDRLGDANDLAVLREHAVDPATIRLRADNQAALLKLVRLRETRLRASALRLGRLAFAEKRGPFVARLQAYWQR